tara:strand:+ start:13309 stop:14562 length:1254 start_codon:yes stop_codon:yes gene_type:complete
MFNLKKLKVNNLVFLFSIIFLINGPLKGQDLKLATEFRYVKNDKSAWFTNYNNFGLPNEDFSSRITFQTSKKSFFLNFDTLIINQNLNILESFIKIDTKFIDYKIGKYYRDFSNYLNDYLSSGHMLISNNAQPMPKIGVLKNIVLYKRKKYEFDFGLSHAMLDKNDYYSKNPFLHEKFIYFKVPMNENSFFQIGFVHEAIWGGETVIDGESTGSTLKDFLKVFISSDGPKIDGSKHANALGNHLGIWDFVYINNNRINSYKIYYQHIFEDTSGLRFHNGTDGLWGFEISNNLNNSNILIELLTTTNQDLNSDYLREGYYNHSTYAKGWSYKNFIIGNPHINNLTIIPLDVIHVGIEKEFKNNFKLQVLTSRRIDKSDSIIYDFIFKKKIKDEFEIKLGLSSANVKDILSFAVNWQLD